MKPYIVIVHKDEHSAYGMSFPDAPGCFSAADEIDDIFAMAAEALEGWTEAMHRIRRSDCRRRAICRTCKADPKWADSFEDAELVIALPAPRPELIQAGRLINSSPSRLAGKCA